MAYYRGKSNENEVVRCKCNEIAMLRVSRQPRSEGMQFYGCPKYRNDKENYCNFFQWVDKNEAKDRELSESGSSISSRMRKSMAFESESSQKKSSNDWPLQHIEYLETKIADQIQALKDRDSELLDKIKEVRVEVENKFFIIIGLVILLCIVFIIIAVCIVMKGI